MTGEDSPRRWVGEDELILADMEGVAAARATVQLGRERRRQLRDRRWEHLERIRAVHGSRDDEDFLLRVFHRVLGYVPEEIWDDALEELRERVTDDDLPWEKPSAVLARLDGLLGTDGRVNDRALFEREETAISGMSITRARAIRLAQAVLDDEQSSQRVDERYVHPNPYLDLWLVGYGDPSRPDEVIAGGSTLLVLRDGEVVRSGSRPGSEILGAIFPAEEVVWD